MPVEENRSVPFDSWQAQCQDPSPELEAIKAQEDGRRANARLTTEKPPMMQDTLYQRKEELAPEQRAPERERAG